MHCHLGSGGQSTVLLLTRPTEGLSSSLQFSPSPSPCRCVTCKQTYLLASFTSCVRSSVRPSVYGDLQDSPTNGQVRNGEENLLLHKRGFYRRFRRIYALPPFPPLLSLPTFRAPYVGVPFNERKGGGGRRRRPLPTSLVFIRELFFA